MLRASSFLGLALFACACGSGQQGIPPDGPEAPPEQGDPNWDTGEEQAQWTSEKPQKKKKSAPPQEDSDKIPTECSKYSAATCVPAGKWVSRLCADVFADVALFMFQSGTPWQRMYLTRETDAVNASGGASVVGKLAFDEEVLVLRHRQAGVDDIQVGSGNGSYDALRWDGSCVSLEGEEVTSNHPPAAKTSRIEWRWLGEDIQAALRADKTVNDTFLARKKECKGVTMGAVSKKCEMLDKKLIEVTAAFVRGTSGLPQPEHQP